MSENNFIKSVEFNDDFHPFKGGDKIYFGGEKEVQNLIEFYLKSKPENSYEGTAEDNAKRFKINCVLGNNGGGKSSLFEGFYNYEDSKFKSYDSEIDIMPKFDITKKIIFDKKIEAKNIVLDDFYKFSNIFEKSVNYDFINKDSINNEYCKTYSFLDKYKNTFGEYLNLNKNFFYELNIYFNNKFLEKAIWYFLDNKQINNEENYLEEEKVKEYFNIINSFFRYVNGEINNKLFEVIGKENSIYFLLSNLDLCLLLVEEMRGDIVAMHSEVNIEREGFKNFYQLLKIISFLFEKIEKEKLYNELKYYRNSNFLESLEKFKNNFKEYLNKINELKECFRLLKEGQDNDADKIFLEKFGKPKVGKGFKDFLFGETGYEYINHSTDHENLLKEKIFVDKYKSLGISYFIGDLKHIFAEKIKGQNFKYSSKLSDNEKNILKSDFFFNLDIEFNDKKNIKTINNLSSGERISLVRFKNIYNRVYEDKHSSNIILIDEPDLHLHLDWQKKYIQKLIDVFSTLDTNIKLHFIIATHSPFIISDLPAESIIVLDGSEKNKYGGEFTEIIDDYEKKYGRKTFGANFVDLINDGFFFENKVLMGSFAEENIKLFSVAQKFLMLGLDKIREENLNDKEKRTYNFLKENNIEKIEDFKKYIDNIGDEFLKENLLYL